MSLFELSDEELVNKYNEEVLKKGWTQARSYYLDCLQKEIKNRSFNSDMLFDFDAEDKTVAFKIGSKIDLSKNQNDCIK